VTSRPQLPQPHAAANHSKEVWSCRLASFTSLHLESQCDRFGNPLRFSEIRKCSSPATAGLSFASVAVLQSLTVLYWSTMKRILLAAGAMTPRFQLLLAPVASVGTGVLAGMLLWQAAGPPPRVAALDPPLVTAGEPATSAQSTESERLAESLARPRPVPMVAPEPKPGAGWQDEASGVPGDQIAELIARQDEFPYMESLPPEQLAAAIIAKPSDAEIDAALAELDPSPPSSPPGSPPAIHSFGGATRWQPPRDPADP